MATELGAEEAGAEVAVGVLDDRHHHQARPGLLGSVRRRRVTGGRGRRVRVVIDMRWEVLGINLPALAGRYAALQRCCMSSHRSGAGGPYPIYAARRDKRQVDRGRSTHVGQVGRLMQLRLMIVVVLILVLLAYTGTAWVVLSSVQGRPFAALTRPTRTHPDYRLCRAQRS
jgi:hypothetical protein